MDKFTSQIQVEESADFQEWLDTQEVADLLAMEDEGKRELDEFDMRCEEAEQEAEALFNVRAMAIEQGLSDEVIDEINLELSEGEYNALI
jgi:hypothetical protein